MTTNTTDNRPGDRPEIGRGVRKSDACPRCGARVEVLELVDDATVERCRGLRCCWWRLSGTYGTVEG